ncbi:hypothetical protein HG537_0H02350 [Torulaspora globosa]|uniref:NADP-dependent oxidoreductase domain-containing protein n=1 Tax=Torulaspora globosa TaxID=48254 RepID=A0A7H9HYM2_9SACH|nr:hypothetical protein HG537_0H02350 [Torulaspora sp. CBS 2947]
MTALPSTLKLQQELSSIDTGYGLMSLTWRAEPVPKPQAFDAMKKVIEIAQSMGHKAFFNVGEFYGRDRANLCYVKEFFEKYPELRKDTLISCKGAADLETLVPNGRHDNVVKSVENCIAAIGGFIDIFEPARLDLSICSDGQTYPYETFEALAEMVERGAIGGISLSEVTAEQIRAIAKDWSKYLVCVEVELSMFTSAILTNGVLEATNDLKLVTIIYSPLGRGLLTGTITSSKDIPAGDFRGQLQRFKDESLKQNLTLVAFLQEEIVQKRPKNDQITLPQLALGWVKHWNKTNLCANTHLLPIPSGSSVTRVEENMNEVKAQITDEEFQKINDYLKSFKTIGDAYEMAK